MVLHTRQAIRWQERASVECPFLLCVQAAVGRARPRPCANSGVANLGLDGANGSILLPRRDGPKAPRIFALVDV